MRLILASALAPAIILLSLTVVDAETKYQGPVRDSEQPIGSLEFNISIGEYEPASTTSEEPSDEPHRQGEETAEPPQPPIPADANMSVGPHTLHSVSDLCSALYTSAEDNNIPVPFFANLIWQESGLQRDSVSSAGALGIAQFMPKVAAEVGLHDPFDPQQALPASARFLRALRDQFGNLGFVAAAYNAGAHRVIDWLDHHRALPQETKTYVLRVTGRSAEAWRKSQLPDSQLTFVRPLPCRHLPGFAQLEQAQIEQARAQAPIEPEKSQSEKVAPKLVRTITAAKKVAQRAVKAATSKTRQKAVKVAQLTENAAEKAEKKRPVGHRGADEPKVAHSARNFHAGKHEAVRPAHSPHEKRKVA